jgi:DNA-binding transcriptional LysR family regulator
MRRDELADLMVFLAVAEERSFTRAAARMGTSQSALSHTVQRLEARLGLRLLTRTTRSVAPTAAGERLIETLGPALNAIDAKLTTLTELRDKPSGTVRITTSDHAAESYLWPVLKKFLPDYPDITVELTIDHGLTDIVTERYDAGVRLGESIAKDMIAVPVSPEMRMIVVGSPAYFASHPKPRTPQELASHACINMRMVSAGSIYAWEFEKGGRELKVRVEGPLVFNSVRMAMQAALSGLGLAYVPEDLAQALVDSGRLVRVLNDWCQPFAGFHLYYPSRRQHAPAFAMLVEALRYRKSRARG